MEVIKTSSGVAELSVSVLFFYFFSSQGRVFFVSVCVCFVSSEYGR